MSRESPPAGKRLRGWRRLVRLGVAPRASPLDTRHVVVINTLVLISLSATVVLAPYDLVMHPSLALALIYVLVPLVYLVILLLNAARLHNLAGVVFLTVLFSATSLSVIVQGAKSGIQYGFLGEILAAFLVFHYRSPRLAALFGAVGCVLFTATGLFEPWLATLAPIQRDNTMFHAATTQVVLLLVILGYYSRSIAATTALRIVGERTVYREMLASIFPSGIAEQLAAGKTIPARQHARASVLICDLVGFTRLSEELAPEELVALLGDIFRRFDTLCVTHGVEKIRTNGDAYVAAAGLNGQAEASTASQVVALAVDMRTQIEAVSRQRGRPIAVRIGIGTGPVIAGVIGRRRRTFDLWGEAIRSARVLEAGGTPGEIRGDASTVEDCPGAVWAPIADGGGARLVTPPQREAVDPVLAGVTDS